MDAPSKFTDAGRVPVFGCDNPAGKDPSSGLEYLYLQDQIRRRGKGLAPQWDHVAIVCREILCSQGKHLYAGVYLAIALVRLFGLEGLCCASTMLRELTCLYWEGMYPGLERERARFNAYSLWEDETRLFVATCTLDRAPESGMGARLEEDVLALQAFLDTHLDAPGLFADLVAFARRLQIPVMPGLPNESLDTTQPAQPLAPLPPRPSSPILRMAGLLGSFFGFGGKNRR